MTAADKATVIAEQLIAEIERDKDVRSSYKGGFIAGARLVALRLKSALPESEPPTPWQPMSELSPDYKGAFILLTDLKAIRLVRRQPSYENRFLTIADTPESIFSKASESFYTLVVRLPAPPTESRTEDK